MIVTEVDVRNAELRMKPRLSVALVTALFAVWIAAAVRSDAGSCRHERSHVCFKGPATLDFSSVSDISKDIVANQPHSPPRQKPAFDPQPAADPYTGPMIGSSRVGVPTVGYYWSIH
jgi:hypothetical protein